jgi:hypothetical protein
MPEFLIKVWVTADNEADAQAVRDEIAQSMADARDSDPDWPDTVDAHADNPEHCG